MALQANNIENTTIVGKTTHQLKLVAKDKHNIKKALNANILSLLIMPKRPPNK